MAKSQNRADDDQFLCTVLNQPIKAKIVKWIFQLGREKPLWYCWVYQNNTIEYSVCSMEVKGVTLEKYVKRGIERGVNNNIVDFVVVCSRSNSENLKRPHIFPCKTFSQSLSIKDFKLHFVSNLLKNWSRYRKITHFIWSWASCLTKNVGNPGRPFLGFSLPARLLTASLLSCKLKLLNLPSYASYMYAVI